MSSYSGMRWLKCDLQMQTPADRQHWSGAALVEGREAEAAKAFAEACHEARLDAIGITDHNFLSKDFIPHLYAALDEVEREHGNRITVFPGFEFEAAGVGRGVHVLCLFDPGTDLTLVDNILTECGIRYPRIDGNGQLRKSQKNLIEILSLIQGVYGGIVIMPHAMSNDGIFDNDSISEWLQQDQFTNPDLLAIEVPKPASSMSNGFQRLLRSGADCQAEWKRERPIATVMSSDNKKLIETDTDGKPVANSIGYRYSWIKMSRPSVESLRQAFLDHESRIILPDDVCNDIHPSKRSSHAVIESISISDVAFLSDQQVCFSPNLNCIIGGRGSGKSTLLEYLRIMFGKDRGKDLDGHTRERVSRIRSTLADSRASVEVTWNSADGVKDTIQWSPSGPQVIDRQLADAETYFANLPIDFYSQQQLNRLTESISGEDGARQAQRLLKLVDGFAKNDLAALNEEEHRLQIKVRDAFSQARKKKVLQKDLSKLQQEFQEVDRQWRARSEIQSAASRHELLQNEAKFINRLFSSDIQTLASVVSQIDEFTKAHQPLESADAPHKTLLDDLGAKVLVAKQQLAKSIRELVDSYQSDIRRERDAVSGWPEVQAEIDSTSVAFKAECERLGLSPEDVGRLQEISSERSTLQQRIDSLREDIASLESDSDDPDSLIHELHLVWQEQFHARQAAATRANELAVLEDGHQQFIEVEAQFQQDHSHFMEIWNQFIPGDKRTRLGRNWDVYGQQILRSFSDDPGSLSPWTVLKNYLDGSSDYPESIRPMDPIAVDRDVLAEYVQENSEKWEKICCSRVTDVVDLKLFRSDGSVAGQISDGSLSDGQRNTAALALLLAQSGGPLVIDQPEDELDSNFVFRELIPMLRRVKIKRQLIMATHNANLPVNGDAELVYAFEARDGKGMHLASGGLDQNSVTNAVLDIMEGTREAFRRRREKFHF